MTHQSPLANWPACAGCDNVQVMPHWLTWLTRFPPVEPIRPLRPLVLPMPTALRPDCANIPWPYMVWPCRDDVLGTPKGHCRELPDTEKAQETSGRTSSEQPGMPRLASDIGSEM